jgi:hypothetical protein
MTSLQYGVLNYIIKERPKLEVSKFMLQTTLSSLFRHRWVYVYNGRLNATVTGTEELELTQTKLHTWKRSEKSRGRELSPRLKEWLGSYRKILEMRKIG